MFTWMQTVMQKHYKWLFSILLVVIIVAFVGTIGNTGVGGGGSTTSFRQDFYGFDINPRSPDMEDLSTATQLSMMLDSRRPQQTSFEREVLGRAVLLKLADDLNIPAPTDEQFTEYLQSKRAFTNPVNNEFSYDQYTQLVDMIKGNPRLSEERVSQVIAEDYRISKVKSALSGPGYVLPYSAKQDLERRETKWSIAIAKVDKASFKPNFTPEDAAIAEYFDKNKENYRIKEKFVAKYVEFSAKDFVDQITEEPESSELQSHYARNRTTFPKNDDGTPKSFADVKDLVIESWKESKAARFAAVQANEFAKALYEKVYAKEITKGSPEFNAFIESNGLSLKDLPAFSADRIPTLPNIPHKAISEVLKLDDTRFYSDGLQTDNGAVVFFYESTIDSTLPELESIKAKVTADYKRAENDRLFREHGEALVEELKATVAAGTEFKAAAEAKSLTVEEHSDFTSMSPPEGLSGMLLYEIQDMEKGDISDLLNVGADHIIVSIAKREVPELDIESEEVQSSIDQLSTYAAIATEQSILTEMIEAGMKTARPEVAE